VKVRAAECVMNHSSKTIEIEDVEFRAAELEWAACVLVDAWLRDHRAVHQPVHHAIASVSGPSARGHIAAFVGE